MIKLSKNTTFLQDRRENHADTVVFFDCNCKSGLFRVKYFKNMSEIFSLSKRLILLGLGIALGYCLPAQNVFTKQESEFSVTDPIKGDQVLPAVSISQNGGYIVWQDNATDGNGLGISARRLNASLSGQYGSFRVNQQSSGDQGKPEVVVLEDGSAVFVWEGNQRGNKDIYASFLNPQGVFITGDILVNTYTNADQSTPAISALKDGRVVITWSSFQQDGSYEGIFARIFSATGQPAGAEFQVNQFTNFNQRSPSIATLPNGNFVIVWVSEMQRSDKSVDIYGRVFNPNGFPITDEFQINTTTNVCANPSVTATADGGFVVVWGQRSPVVRDPSINVAFNGWDIMARAYTPGLKAIGNGVRINSYVYGDQITPKISAIGNDLFAVWTSIGQDGSREGVFGRFINFNGQPVGDEFRINTTTVSSQIHPAIASDGARRFLVVWSSFTGIDIGMDLYAQRFAMVSEPLPAPSAPVASALSQSRIGVSWAEVSGFNIAKYELYVDGATTPIEVTSNYYTVTGLAPGSTHTFAIAYVLTDGRRSPLSTEVTARTWGEDLNMDGLPDDWQASYWGQNPAVWPAANIDSDGDGASNLQEFLAGTNPVDPRSVLRVRIARTLQGRFLYWNTQPGFVYQVQFSTNINQWNNLGSPRFAAGYQDSMLIDSAHNASFYRVIRIR